ncbi:MAG: heme transporter substrate-binding protein [Paenibacillus sp.]|nr:heme transporter substrate-binding protein [Paenibacillus sp.]
MGKKLRNLAAAISVVLIVILVGCTSASETGSNGGATDQQPSDGAQRIVSSTVAITEIMDALEIDLVGVPTSEKALPKRYKGITDIGNPMSPDMEIVRMLKPTSVLSVTTLEYDLKPKFTNAGVQAEFLDLSSLDKMSSTIDSLGKKYGKEQQAEAIVKQYTTKLAAISEQVKGKKQPNVLILMGIPGSYLVATEHSYIGDLVKRAGGINVVKGEKVEFVASNTEHLQQAKPDVILRAAHGLPDEVVKMFNKEFQKNDIWKHFEAVKQNKVYDLEESLFGTTGNLAVGTALDQLVEMLY